MVRFGVRVKASVNSYRDSFSVLLRAKHYSNLKTAGTVNTS